MSHSLYEHYGGFAKVSRMVMRFYDKVLDSDVLGPYFDGVDMRRLVDHQTRFVTYLMGGPASYTDEMLRQIHARLDVDDGAFDELAATFRVTLEEFELAPEHVDQLVGEVTSRRGLIVTKK
jgi:hemoglobin